MSGARFVRADLHIHTMLGPGEIGAGTPPTVANMIAAARAAGLSVIAITDHNTIANVDAAMALGDADLLVLPGIEITATDGDLIAIFSPAQIEQLREFASDGVMKTREVDASGARRSTRSLSLIHI